MPQGSLEAQATSKRSMIKIVVSTILAIHGVVLGGLLFLGCKEDAPDSDAPQFADSGLQNTDPIDQEDDPFASLLPPTDEPVEIPGAADGQPPSDSSGLPPLPPINDSRGFDVDPGTPGLPGMTETVRVPEKGAAFPPREPLLPTQPPQEPTSYVVLPGDNFTTIARDHGMKVADLVAANPGVDSRRLQVGQKLNLPPNVPAVTPSIPTPGSENRTGTVHVVVSGDTLFGLERKYGVPVKQIQEANNLRGSTIRVGQKLDIPIPNN